MRISSQTLKGQHLLLELPRGKTEFTRPGYEVCIIERTFSFQPTPFVNTFGLLSSPATTTPSVAASFAPLLQPFQHRIKIDNAVRMPLSIYKAPTIFFFYKAPTIDLLVSFALYHAINLATSNNSGVASSSHRSVMSTGEDQ